MELRLSPTPSNKEHPLPPRGVDGNHLGSFYFLPAGVVSMESGRSRFSPEPSSKEANASPPPLMMSFEAT